MWIEVDFDERIFPDYVWTDFFQSARALCHVTEGEVERVRITGHALPIEGELAKLVRLVVTVRVFDAAEQRTFEFAPRGRWRMRRSLDDDTPFTTHMPEALHDYERDVLLRSELQIGILQNYVRRWLGELRAQGPAAEPPPGPSSRR